MAVLRRSSSEEDIDQDEDALLKSKWSLAMFPELSHSDDQELLLLEKWLQVELRPPFWIVSWTFGTLCMVQCTASCCQDL